MTIIVGGNTATTAAAGKEATRIRKKSLATVTFRASGMDMNPSLELVTDRIIPMDTWMHIALTSSNNTAILYINGQQRATGHFKGPRIGSLGALLLVGSTIDNSSSFQGHIYRMRIWERWLAETMLRRDCMCSMEGTPGLVAELCCSDADLSLFGIDVRWDDTVEGVSLNKINNHIEEKERQHCSLMEQEQEQKQEQGAIASRFHCVITPKFSLQRVLRKGIFVEKLVDFQNEYVAIEFKHDKALVRYLNTLGGKMGSDGNRVSNTASSYSSSNVSSNSYIEGDTGSGSSHSSNHMNGNSKCTQPPITLAHLLQCQWQDISPSEETLQSHHLLSDMIHLREGSQGCETVLSARFQILQQLNKELLTSLPLFDLRLANQPGSIAHTLCISRDLIFEKTKDFFWNHALLTTKEVVVRKFDVHISRSRAAKHQRTGRPDDEGRWVVFSQVFRQLHALHPQKLRQHGQIFKVILKGEHANDYGGPYAEIFTIMIAELQSPCLSLLIRSPDGDKWLLNPGAVSTLHIEMFVFFGKLLGIAARTKEYLALNLAALIWKLLVQESPLAEDLETINLGAFQALKLMRHIEQQGIQSEEVFDTIFFETFTVLSSDNRQVDLIPGGANTPVTFSNRHQYCDLTEQYRLHEFDKQIAAVRRGLASIVPVHLLSIFSGSQLEGIVCGKKVMDIALLRSMTVYTGCTEADPHIEYFWTLMEEEFSEDEKSAFLRFVSGRSRLPLNRESFPRKFKIQAFGKAMDRGLVVDQYLPVSHTCFMSLELPRYSSLEIMRDKLKYAIFNCQAIDGDGDSAGNSAAALGWEE